MLIDANLLVKYKFGEIIKYITKINFGAGTNYGAMNQKAYDKLPSQVQTKLEEMYNGQENIFKIDTDLMKNHYQMRIQAQKLYGTEFYDFPEAEMQKIMKIVQPVRDEYASFLDSKGFNGKELIEKFDQLNAKY
jgi:TRAP-type C4-dicarboxylate transport system substrate-binding protein